MSIKHIIILASSALSFLGCSEAEPQRSEPVERAASSEPILTATAAPTPIEPITVVSPPKAQEEEPKTVEAPKAPTTPDAPSVEPVVETMDGVTIQRLITASEIEKREPVDPTTTFGPQHEKVYAFVEVSNESDSNKSLFVHFIGPNEKVSGGIELEIPASAPRWRTWAYTRHFAAPGPWRVEIRDSDGGLVGALPFEVEAGF